MNKDSLIYVAGHKGMVGSAVWRILEEEGYKNIISKTSKELDLRNQFQVNTFISKNKPDIVIDAAARVGGILANSQYPYQFLMDNMQIQNNLIQASHENGIKKFVFLGSSCIYPKLAKQPIKETYLLTNSLEPTNEWYAIAKIAGVKLCEAIHKQFHKDFVSLMPTNLYGSDDNFDLKTSHVLPAMIRKFHDAKLNNHETVVLWGNGTPLREFLHVDDMAKAVLFSIENKFTEHLYNIGSGKEITINSLAQLVQKTVGHTGEIIWDTSKPNGTPRKLLDVSKINSLGWKASIELNEGIASTYDWYLKNIESLKKVTII